MTEERKANYDEDLKINLNDLHGDVLIQAQRYMDYSRMSADAQRDRDRAKENLDVVRAELDDKIRTSPFDFGAAENKDGSPKLTESWISATIILQPEYKEAVDRLNKANFDLNVYASAVRAFDHRKKMLELEVQLWTGGYWSAPNLPKVIEEIRGVAQAEQRKGINRKRG